MGLVLNDYLISFGSIVAILIIMSVALPGLVWIFNKIIADIDIVRELKKKNTAVAILLASVVIGACLVIGLVV